MEDISSDRGALWTRRQALAVVGAALPMLATPAVARDVPVGSVADAVGEAYARLESVRRLVARSELMLGDLVWTAERSRASLDLDGGTVVHLGSMTRLRIDRYIAETGGELVLGDGAMVFDRPDDLPKQDLTVRGVFGLIGVRGTRFFAGPSRGAFGVFVERGAVRVSAAGVEVDVRAGEGTSIGRRGDPPSEVAEWSADRIAEALASVFG